MKKIILSSLLLQLLVVSSYVHAISDVAFNNLQADYGNKKAGYLANPIANASTARNQLESIRGQIGSVGKNSRWQDAKNAWVDNELGLFEDAFSAASAAQAAQAARRPAPTPAAPSGPTPAGLPAPAAGGPLAPAPAGGGAPQPGQPAPRPPIGLPAPQGQLPGALSPEAQRALIVALVQDFRTAAGEGDIAEMMAIQERVALLFPTITVLNAAEKKQLLDLAQKTIDDQRAPGVPAAPAAPFVPVANPGYQKAAKDAEAQRIQLVDFANKLTDDFNTLLHQPNLTLVRLRAFRADAGKRITDFTNRLNLLSAYTKNEITQHVLEGIDRSIRNLEENAERIGLPAPQGQLPGALSPDAQRNLIAALSMDIGTARDEGDIAEMMAIKERMALLLPTITILNAAEKQQLLDLAQQAIEEARAAQVPGAPAAPPAPAAPAAPIANPDFQKAQKAAQAQRQQLQNFVIQLSNDFNPNATLVRLRAFKADAGKRITDLTSTLNLLSEYTKNEIAKGLLEDIDRAIQKAEKYAKKAGS